MANLFICFLYVLEGVIFGGLGFVLKRKRSEFPDFRVGYHAEKFMTDKDRWNYANRVTGNICLVSFVVFVVTAVVMYCCKVALGANLIVFFALSLLAILGALLLPIALVKRKFQGS